MVFIKQNAGLDQAGIKIEISIISDMQMITTLMAESEEELRNLLEKVKEENLKASAQQRKLLAR